MKKLGILFIMIFTGVHILHASALTDAANREKARRAALHADIKKVKVFTNADIENLKSTLAFSAPSQPAEPEETIAPSPAVEQPKKEENNEEKEALKQEREELQRRAQEAQATINQGGGYFTRNIGNQYQTIRESNQRIREIDEKLKKNDRASDENQQDREEQPQ
jgi:gamma-glutamylcysteine synthetase